MAKAEPTYTQSQWQIEEQFKAFIPGKTEPNPKYSQFTASQKAIHDLLLHLARSDAQRSTYSARLSKIREHWNRWTLREKTPSPHDYRGLDYENYEGMTIGFQAQSFRALEDNILS